MNTTKKSDKQKPIKRKYVKQAAVASNQSAAQPFEIETAPPNFRLNPDLANTLNRVEATINIIQPGQAFIVPSKSRHSIKKFIEEKWPLHQFLYSIIKDNKNMMRIYFIRKIKG